MEIKMHTVHIPLCQGPHEQLKSCDERSIKILVSNHYSYQQPKINVKCLKINDLLAMQIVKQHNDPKTGAETL